MTAPTQTIVMTGATRGIGSEAARGILHRSPEVHLVLLARETAGTEVLPHPQEISPEVSMIGTDLASKASVESAAAQLEDLFDAGRLPALRGLVCNGGVHLDDALHTTVDGYETTSRQRPVDPPAPATIASAPAHTGTHHRHRQRRALRRHPAHRRTLPPPGWSSPEIFSRPGAFDRPDRVRAGRRAYATSKLVGVHLDHELAPRLPDGIDIVSYNPSLVTWTGLARDAGGAFPFLMKWIVPFLEATAFVDTAPVAGRKLADVILGAISAPPAPTPIAPGSWRLRTSRTTPIASALYGTGWNKPTPLTIARTPTQLSEMQHSKRTEHYHDKKSPPTASRGSLASVAHRVGHRVTEIEGRWVAPCHLRSHRPHTPFEIWEHDSMIRSR